MTSMRQSSQNLPLPQLNQQELSVMDLERLERLTNSNDRRNREIIEDIDNFDLPSQYHKNKYIPLGRLPKLAAYKEKLDNLIYEKFNNPENVDARKRIFMSKRCNSSF